MLDVDLLSIHYDGAHSFDLSALDRRGEFKLILVLISQVFINRKGGRLGVMNQ